MTTAEPTTTTHDSAIKIHLTTVHDKTPCENKAYLFQILHEISIHQVNNTLSHLNEPTQITSIEDEGLIHKSLNK